MTIGRTETRNILHGQTFHCICQLAFLKNSLIETPHCDWMTLCSQIIDVPFFLSTTHPMSIQSMLCIPFGAPDISIYSSGKCNVPYFPNFNMACMGQLEQKAVRDGLYVWSLQWHLLYDQNITSFVGSTL